MAAATERKSPAVRFTTWRIRFFTIGHSTRGIAEFLELLTSNDIRTLVDVRTVPRSRTNPQFNRDILPDSLARQEIAYVHIPELGGIRGPPAEIETSPNTSWQNESFRNYADYAMTEPFMAGLLNLIGIGHAARSAIMCAEAVWWRCHRRIIADYLVSRGERVIHILSSDAKHQVFPEALRENLSTA